MIYLVGAVVATGIQSSIYAGLTTGLFSTCQSIGWIWVVGLISYVSFAAGVTILDSFFESEASDAGGSTNSSPPYS
jgi:hypothetical protein